MALFLLFFIVIPVIIGVLAACLALPLRLVLPSQSNQTMRRPVIFFLALLAFLTVFTLSIYIDASLTYVFGEVSPRPHIWVGSEIVGDVFSESLRENRPAIIAELWVRYMIPPVVRQSCYTQNETVCTFADAFMDTSVDWLGILPNPLVLVRVLLSALVTGVTVSLFTRRRSS
jgi:hypothetical protein